MKQGYLAARCCHLVRVLSANAAPCLLFSLLTILDGTGWWYGQEAVLLLVKFVSYLLSWTMKLYGQGGTIAWYDRLVVPVVVDASSSFGSPGVLTVRLVGTGSSVVPVVICANSVLRNF